jgi:hypothetical protein
MKYRAAIMNDQTPILLLNWTIVPPKLECTLRNISWLRRSWLVTLSLLTFSWLRCSRVVIQSHGTRFELMCSNQSYLEIIAQDFHSHDGMLI